MKQDPRTIINTNEDHTFNKPADKKAIDNTQKMCRLSLGRKGGYLPMYVMINPKAVATVILLPGKDADFGEIILGEPSSINFMSRTRNIFFNEDFNVIVVYRASDLVTDEFSDRYRQTDHVSEITSVIEFANKKFKKPIWLIGNSRGTISAIATAIELGNKKVTGIVLTSTVTASYVGYTPIRLMDIDKLKMPILIVHHSKDECGICVPNDASSLFTNFTSSKIKKFIMVNGGSNPTGNPCLPLHWHGYINYEKETVKLISTWIKKPTV